MSLVLREEYEKERKRERKRKKRKRGKKELKRERKRWKIIEKERERERPFSTQFRQSHVEFLGCLKEVLTVIGVSQSKHIVCRVR